MREEFCTITDLGHLPQVLVLQRSLERVCDRFRLRVLCMDAAAERSLSRLAPPGIVVIPLARLERDDPEFAATRSGRTHAEYCWTAKSALCKWALEREPGLELLTFLDADTMFFAPPSDLFDELDSGSVLLVRNRHGFREDILRLSPPPLDSPEWRRPPAPLQKRLDWVFGPYNAGTVGFSNTSTGLAAARWWRERSIERCSARFDGRSFGEQRYLWMLERRFDDVRVLQHPGAGPSPGGTSGHRLARDGDTILIDGRRFTFFHYESLGIHTRRWTSRFLGARPLTDEPRPLDVQIARYFRVEPVEWDLFFRPYLGELGHAIRDLAAIEPAYLDSLRPASVRKRLRFHARATSAAAHRTAARRLPQRVRTMLAGRGRR